MYLCLPPGCKLTLEGSLEMCCRTWSNYWEESSMERNLSILHVTTSKPYDPDATNEFSDDEEPMDRLQTEKDKLQHIFTVTYPFLTRLYLSCSAFGTAESPVLLDANFPCLTTLRLAVAHKSGIYITMSAAVQLEAVRLDARTGTLSVTLEDVVAFAENLVVLEVRHRKVLGSSLRQLAAELSQRPSGQVMDLGDVWAWCASSRSLRSTMTSYFCQAYVHEGSMKYACDCGACQACLVRTGALLPF